MDGRGQHDHRDHQAQHVHGKSPLAAGHLLCPAPSRRPGRYPGSGVQAHLAGLAEPLLAEAETSELYGGQIRDGVLHSPSYADLGQVRLHEGGTVPGLDDTGELKNAGGITRTCRTARWRLNTSSPLGRRRLQVESDTGVGGPPPHSWSPSATAPASPSMAVGVRTPPGPGPRSPPSAPQTARRNQKASHREFDGGAIPLDIISVSIHASKTFSDNINREISQTFTADIGGDGPSPERASRAASNAQSRYTQALQRAEPPVEAARKSSTPSERGFTMRAHTRIKKVAIAVVSAPLLAIAAGAGAAHAAATAAPEHVVSFHYDNGWGWGWGWGGGHHHGNGWGWGWGGGHHHGNGWGWGHNGGGWGHNGGGWGHNGGGWGHNGGGWGHNGGGWGH
ncbi:hypothetical protein SRB17_87170 [Streptomyces sp. RB17]|nr:hypothetical protein [Streptomyces sp. RB17]